MLFRQLEYFVALARERHFARAAQSCYVSQPALSEAIQKLEHELGVPLVNRGRSFEGLTPEGERLVGWARRILADQEALKQEVAAMQSGLSGQLRLGVVPSASTTASLLLEPFCSAHPLVRVALETGLPTTAILAKLDHFELDAGIVHSEPDAPRTWTPTHLYHERVALVASRQLLPDSIEQLAWSELIQFPLCGLNESMRGRQLVDEALARHDLALRPEIVTDSIAAIFSLAATGRWAGVVPQSWFHSFPRPPDVRLIPLVDPVVASPVVLVTVPSDPGSVLGNAFAAAAKTMALDEFFTAALLSPRRARAGSPGADITTRDAMPAPGER